MTRPIRILELRSVRGTGGGPEKTILLGTARTDPRMFAITICYLRDARDPVFDIDRKAAGLPVEYIELVERHSFDPAIWSKLRGLVQSRGIDIVHGHEYKTDLLASLLAARERVLPLATVHGWTGRTTRERWLYYPLDKQLLRRFPRLIAVSNDIRDELVRHGVKGERIVTILNGIDPSAFRRDQARVADARSRLGLAPDDFAIGAVGRLEPQKCFDVLIDAFAALHREHPGARLLNAGDGSLKASLAAAIEARGLSACARLLGHRSDVVDLHHAFDLFVQSSDYEGTPNAVLEAMALETPVVATRAGGTAEIARHRIDGLIVPAHDASALVEAMRAVLVDPSAARDRACSARRRVESDLSFDARMRAVEQVYVDLMNGGAAAGRVTPVAART